MSRRKNLNRKKEINEIFRDTFAEKGFHATSMRDVAEKLNINKATLYYYVTSKEQALFDAVDEQITEAINSLKNIICREDNAEQRFIQILEHYTRRFVPDKNHLLLLLNEVGALNDEHKKIFNAKQIEFLSMFISILEELKSKGKLKEIPLMIIVFSFLGMAHYTTKWYDKDGSVKIDELATIFREILTNGIFK